MGPHCNCSNPKSPFSHKNMRKVQKSQKTYPLNVAILHLLVCFMTHIDVFSGQKRIFQILHFSPIVFPIKTLKMVARPQFLSKYSIFFLQTLRNRPLHIVANRWLTTKNAHCAVCVPPAGRHDWGSNPEELSPGTCRCSRDELKQRHYWGTLHCTL